MTKPSEHIVYARWLDWGMRVGFAVLAAAFFAYAFHLVEPLVPLEDLPAVWALPLERYLALTGAPTGWRWIGMLGKGESLCLLGVALLGSVTLVCYLRLAALLLARGERLQAALAIAQVLVLLAAASGVLSGGG